MRKKSGIIKWGLAACAGVMLLLASREGIAQAVPELMYYKFNAAGSQINAASAPVGTNPSPIMGSSLSIGSPSQFGTALVGTGGPTATDYVNNGWLTNLAATPWTISLWVNNIPSGTTLYYLFGDGGNAMRCFVNGAPGSGNMRLTGTGLPNVDVPGVTSGPTVIHFVRTTSPNEIKAYKNGVLAVTVAITGTPTVGTGFKIGAYNTGLNGLLGQMDEFRLYNRALDQTEITATWNAELPLGPCTSPPVPGNSTVLPAGPVCTGTPEILTLSGNSSGSGQTYEWESSANLAGPYTSFSGPLTSPAFAFNAPSTSTYYRCAVTCGTSTEYSTPVQLVVNAAFPGGVYTINSALPTSGTNYQTFGDAVDALSCGISGSVTFNVNATSGPYNEQVIIPQIGGASATNTITFNGNGRTLTFNSTNTNERAVIKLNGADHITINNLVITAPGTLTSEYGFGVQMINDADNNTISNCTINLNTSSTSTTNYAGILINSTNTAIITAGSSLCDENTLIGNTITGGYAGIAIVGNTNTSMVNDNNIINNIIKDFYLYGIYANGNNGTLIEGNNISRPSRTAVSDFRGIYFTANSRNCHISKNRLHNPFDGDPAQNSLSVGINLNLVNAAVTEENVISNNLIYNMISGQTTTNMNGILLNNATFAKVYHNTIVLDHTASTATTGGTRGIYVQAPVANNAIEVKNNIIYISRGGAGPKQCIYYEGSGITLNSDNNDMVMASTTGTVQFGFANGAGYADLAAWQAGTNQDLLSASVNPLFANVGTDDYTPTAPAINNIGAPVGITTDINNAPRSATTPDPGAIEFTVAGCTTPPNPGTATVSGSPVCQNSSITLNLTGHSVGAGQTFQWQSSSNIAGPYNDVGGVLTSPGFITAIGATTMYYRAAVTCSGNTQFSVPVEVIAISALSGTYTINSNQPPSATNFQTFNAAVDALSCGIVGPVVFNVDALSGPYTEQVIIGPVTGTSNANTITFNGNARTLQYLSINSTERAVIKLNGADHIIFNNLVITALGTTTSEYGFGVHVTNDADSNVINNCTININTSSTSTNYAGIVVSGSATSATGTGTTLCDDNLFLNNTVTGGYYGMTLTATFSGGANGFNRFIGNNVKDFYLYGIYVAASYNTTIEGNSFSRPTRTSVSDFNGIYFNTQSNSALVSKNKIFDPFGGALTSTSAFYGIYFNSAGASVNNNNVVSNNLIYNVNGNGQVYGMANVGSSFMDYFHNTVSLDNASSTSTAATRGFHQATAAGGINFFNNLISITRGGTGDKHCIYLGNNLLATANYNNYYISSATGNDYVGFYTSNRPTLLDWQTATSQEAQSLSTNPVFTDPAGGNFAPTNAGLDNQGFFVGVATDINNAPRSATTPDIGAIEFTPPICTSPPVAGNATISATEVCVNTPVQLGLTGNTIGLTQTYRWERSTSLAGPYSPFGNVITNPDSVIIASSTFYYRVAVTCSGNTAFSAPVLLTVNPALPSGTYTIDQTGASSPDFLTFNEAKAAMACGIDGPVTFNVVVGSGPYVEQLTLDSIPGTSAINTVTFNGNGETIIDTSTNTNERAVIKLNGADFVGFYNLHIVAGGTTASEYGFGVQIINNADNNTINNCTIDINTTSTSTSAYAGVVINSTHTAITTTGNSRCDNNTISFNTITGGYAGIAVVANTSTNTINNNRLFNNTIRDFYTYGIYVNGTTNMLVEGNDISRPTRTNSGTIVYGVYFTTVSRSAKISKNRIHNPFDAMPTTANDAYGIYLTTVDAPLGSENVISNNAIYNMNGEGIIYGMYNAGSDNAIYYHNTINIDNPTSTTTAVTRGFYQLTAADGIVLKNNIITIARGGTGNKWAVYFGTSTTDYTSDFNNLYIDPAVTNGYVGYNGSNQLTLANWQAASTEDANSHSFDPLYTNATGGILKPNFGPLDNEGTPVGITTDIVNAPRSPVTPDIGAWEFSVQPCTVPPVAGTSNADPNIGICLGTPIQLTLTGNSSGLGQTFQWESSVSATGPWTALGTPMLIPDTTILATDILYYRAAVTCSGNTVYSTPVLVNMNPPFPAGTYTINNAAPTDYPGGSNFNSFVEAVAVMNCGIDGPVIFNVAPGTYTEQVRMHAISGSSSTNTVTFKAQTGDPASVVLTFTITGGPNYVLQLDSTSNVIYKNMTITANGTTNARAVEITSVASNDSLLNLFINAPASTSTSNAMAGIVGTGMSGSGIVIRGNTINGGSSGMYLVGAAAATPANQLLIESNIVTGSYYYNIYSSNTKRIRVQKNTIEMGAGRNATTYGIYGTNSDTAYEYVGNIINMNNVSSGTSYGMYLTGADAAPSNPGRVANNKISALLGNTGTLYGLYQTGTTFNSTVNNVIVINTSGASSYGIYSTGGGLNRYFNNSVNSVATSATNNYAAYFTNTSGSGVDVRNNIFSHKAGGRAMYVGNTNYVYSDYNMLYTTGSVLVQSGTPAGSHATLAAWRTASSSDVNSIVYPPAFTSTTNLVPNPNDPDSWAIHGRGEQVPGNDYDFNNNPRPTTVVAGVPDLGAYEFLPTIAPPVLAATPATPAAGTTQVFMFGTDTVSKITWKPASNVPSTVAVRRYSGVTPPNMTSGAKHMYFYTDVDATSSIVPEYELKQYYIDPWQGTIPREIVTRLGRTDASGAWLMDAVSTLDSVKNIITRDTLHFLDRFTGMTDSSVAAPPPPPVVVPIDSSNKGTRFWVAYGHHYGFSSNSQDMVLYLSAEQAATVQVKVNGTSWVRTYSIPANTVKVSDILPKTGLVDARLLDEGLSNKGISITSDVPIVAYAHIYDGANSGAGMLLPVGVYGYEYRSLNSRQYYPSGGAGSFSWFFVIADRDSTVVEITPSVLTKGGRPAGVPFTVMLNRGEVYNVMGTQSGGTGSDLSGSTIKSIQNASGKCYPIAVFSGSSRTAICNTTNGDNVIQQVFPNQAWGKKYLTFATASSTSNTAYYSNMWRVMVKDPATVVMKDGVVMTGLITPGNYYEFGITAGSGASTASYIEADQPVMVAQYMLSSDGTGCSGLSAPGGNGDPEQIFISPLEQGIKKAVFYNTTESAITSNYINVIIPTLGLASLTIDGATTFTDVFAHPDLAGYSCVRHNLGSAAGQHIIQSDSAFSAITYGLGSVESYGYNAGTLVKNLRATGSISNVLAGGGTSTYTCTGTPFRFSIRLSVKPTTLVWHFSQVGSIAPATDLTQNSPVPVDSSFANGQWYYVFTINQDFLINSQGSFTLPISVTHPTIEGCANTQDFTLPITVIPAPVADFTYTFPGCVNTTAQFTGTGTTSNGVAINTWEWDFGDGITAAGSPSVSHQWASTGSYNVNLRIVGDDGCIDDTTKTVGVTLPLTVTISPDSIPSCVNSTVTFNVLNPIGGATYNWYTEETGGTLVQTGNLYTFTVPGPVSYYVEVISSSGCVSTVRKKVSVYILPNLQAPVVVVDTIGTNHLRFRWNAVPGATGYEVSIDNGASWTAPSSGATGLTHTVTGLQIGQSVTLQVRTLGGCLPAVSLPVTGTTVTDEVFIPNSFTPNGDGLNDQLRVYSNFIRQMRFVIFNQWGEKIFESSTQSVAWDGTHRGKPQPSGVYMYVCDITLTDGTRMQRKGAINLVR